MILQPCLAPLPMGMRGRSGVEHARRQARLALDACSRKLGLEAHSLSFPRDPERAPLPMQVSGELWHWSTTNTTGLAAALIGPTPLAIDAEWLGRERTEALDAYLPGREVRALGLPKRRGQLALWSAKEAVIKLTGIGMAAMGRTQLELLLAPGRLAISLDGKLYQVLQSWRPEHVLSVACASERELRLELEFSTLGQTASVKN